jgi:UrcA family protein
MNIQKETTKPKKKITLKVYAAPLVMLVMAGALAAPSASAEAARPGYSTVHATFTYNTKAPAEQIYAQLRRLVDRMCANPSPSPLSLRMPSRACVAEAMADGVSRIGRTDIAALHGRTAG